MRLQAQLFRERREPLSGTGSPRSSLLASPLAEEATGLRYAARVTMEGGRTLPVDLSEKTLPELAGKLALMIAGAKNGVQPEFGMRFALEGERSGTRTIAGAEAKVDIRFERSQFDGDEIAGMFRELDRAFAAIKKQG